MFQNLKRYFHDETGSESIEKVVIIGGSVVLAIFIAAFIGKAIGEQMKYLND